jgi:hypothetical protein
VLFVFFLFGCKTQYVPVETVRTDTVRLNHTAHDSIYLHDSTYVFEKGDTYYVERWHTKFKLKEIHDTAYISKTDSVAVPYPVEKKVPVWEQVKMMSVGFVGAVILAVVSAVLIWIAKKFGKI